MREIIKFIEGFQQSDILPFCCPFCDKHSLTLNTDTWFEHDKSQFSEGYHEYVEPEDCIQYIYTAVYECKNDSCNQKVISSGIGKLEVDHFYDEDQLRRVYYSLYQPKIFIPPLHFFQIPQGTPSQIQSLLELSFSIVLQSPSSAVNSLRVCIEELLDIYFPIRDKKLHARIEQDVPKNKTLAPYEEYLMAIKWLGNTGSHGDDIRLIDIMDVYQIMEVILKGLYGTDKSLLEKARLINEVKRPLTRQERKKIS